MSKNIKGNLQLLLCAFIWGIAFVAQVKLDKIPPFTVNAIRSFIGFISLCTVIAVYSKIKKQPFLPVSRESKKRLWLSGILCGTLLCIAVNFQQFGINIYPDGAAKSGRSGFITALYVILVPLLGFFFKRRPGINVWIAVLLAVAGLYFLCMSDGLGGLYMGDLIVLCCAVCFSLQILSIDHFNTVDGMKLSAMQFLVCGILSLVMMFIFEKPRWSEITAAALPLLYLGVVSSGVAYTLQIVGQQNAENPTVASIIMSLESVFAALGGVIIAGESLSAKQIIGCVIMFGAIVVSQIMPGRKKRA